MNLFICKNRIEREMLDKARYKKPYCIDVMIIKVHTASIPTMQFSDVLTVAI